MQFFSDVINRSSDFKPTIELLSELQTRYLHAATYNNLEVILGNIPTLLPKDAFQSVVINNEGGTCRNLNLAFYHLLDTIGFKIHLVSPFVLNYNQMQLHYDRPTHMAIIVNIDDQKYLVDPGWANGSRVPIPLNGTVITHLLGTFRAISDEDGSFHFQRKFEQWVTQFTFNPDTAMHYNDFQDLIDFIYSDDSMYRQCLFVTRAAPKYCIALVDDQIYTTLSNGEKKIESVESKGGISRVLIDDFGLSPHYVNAVVWIKQQILAEAYSKLYSKWTI